MAVLSPTGTALREHAVEAVARYLLSQLIERDALEHIPWSRGRDEMAFVIAKWATDAVKSAERKLPAA